MGKQLNIIVDRSNVISHLDQCHCHRLMVVTEISRYKDVQEMIRDETTSRMTIIHAKSLIALHISFLFFNNPYYSYLTITQPFPIF